MYNKRAEDMIRKTPLPVLWSSQFFVGKKKIYKACSILIVCKSYHHCLGTWSVIFAHLGWGSNPFCTGAHSQQGRRNAAFRSTDPPTSWQWQGASRQVMSLSRLHLRRHTFCACTELHVARCGLGGGSCRKNRLPQLHTVWDNVWDSKKL